MRAKLSAITQLIPDTLMEIGACSRELPQPKFLPVLNKTAEKFGLDIQYADALFGGAAYDVYGAPYPKESQKITKISPV